MVAVFNLSSYYAFCGQRFERNIEYFITMGLVAPIDEPSGIRAVDSGK